MSQISQNALIRHNPDCAMCIDSTQNMDCKCRRHNPASIFVHYNDRVREFVRHNPAVKGYVSSSELVCQTARILVHYNPANLERHNPAWESVRQNQLVNWYAITRRIKLYTQNPRWCVTRWNAVWEFVCHKPSCDWESYNPICELVRHNPNWPVKAKKI